MSPRSQYDKTYLGLRHVSRVVPPAERPVCQYCEKVLRPEASRHEVWLGDDPP